MINVAELKNKNYDYIKKEMEEIVKICKEAGKISKVIFVCFILFSVIYAVILHHFISFVNALLKFNKSK